MWRSIPPLSLLPSVARVRRRERGHILVKVTFHVVTLTTVYAAGMIILAGSVHHRVEALLVRVIADNPKTTARILDSVFSRHLAPYGREYLMNRKCSLSLNPRADRSRDGTSIWRVTNTINLSAHSIACWNSGLEDVSECLLANHDAEVESIAM